MPITISDLPEAPARTMGPDEFSNKADAFLAALQSWGQEVEDAGNFAETNANDAESAKSTAVSAKNDAVAARDAVSADAGVYASTTDGLNNSVDGEYFQVINGDHIEIYRNDSGSATQITSYPARRIHVSSSDPTSGDGNDGDIWLKYTT